MWGDLELNQGHVDYKSIYFEVTFTSLWTNQEYLKSAFNNTALPTELSPQNLPTFTSKKENLKIYNHSQKK